jgi:hypothetical protein
MIRQALQQQWDYLSSDFINSYLIYCLSFSDPLFAQACSFVKAAGASFGCSAIVLKKKN